MSEQPAPDDVTPAPAAPSFFRRHRVRVVVGVVIVAAAVGTGIGLEASHLDHHHTHVTTAAATSTNPSATKSKGAGHRGQHKATRATIVSELGSTWIVKTPAGKTLTVDITAKTLFGTKAVAATRSDFTPGKNVVIVGATTGTTLTAKRVALPVAKPGVTATGSPATT